MGKVGNYDYGEIELHTILLSLDRGLLTPGTCMIALNNLIANMNII